MTILKMSYTLEFVSPTCIPQRRSADSIAASTLIPKNLIVLWQAKRHQEIRWSERGGAPNDGRRKKKRRAKRHSASFVVTRAMFLRSLAMCLVGIASAAAYNPYAQAMELAVVPVVISFLSFISMFRGSFWEEFVQRNITKDNGVAVREAAAAAWKIEIFEYRRVKRHCQGLCCVRTNTQSISLSLTRTRTNTHAAQSSTQPDNDARMFKRHELGVREDHG
jgi:hypothetical protein